MSIVYLLACILAIAAAQAFWAKYLQSKLSVICHCDTVLAEPDQEMVLSVSVSNFSSLPAGYVRLCLYSMPAIQLLDWKTTGKYGEKRADHVLFLLPHVRKTVRSRIKIRERGVYEPGRYYLETSDYLGLRSDVRSGPLTQKVVIMPRRSEETGILRALGGYLGDITVRRFILEDPMLTAGFRDYTGSEPMKTIAWNQTARVGKLMVYQYDHTVEANATVVLNLDGGTIEDREECLRVTRTVCETLEKKRIAYDFYTNGDLYANGKYLFWLAKGLGMQHYRTIMYGLGVSSCRAMDPYRMLVSRCVRNHRMDCGYILITPPQNDVQMQETARIRRAAGMDICILTGQGKETLPCAN